MSQTSSRVRFLTQSGSIYKLNFENMWWSRNNPNRSHALRTGAGTIWHVSPIRVGKSVTITGPPYSAADTADFKADARLIITTPVTRIFGDHEEVDI